MHTWTEQHTADALPGARTLAVQDHLDGESNKGPPIRLWNVLQETRRSIPEEYLNKLQACLRDFKQCSRKKVVMPNIDLQALFFFQQQYLLSFLHYKQSLSPAGMCE